MESTGGAGVWGVVVRTLLRAAGTLRRFARTPGGTLVIGTLVGSLIEDIIGTLVGALDGALVGTLIGTPQQALFEVMFGEVSPLQLASGRGRCSCPCKGTRSAG
jgi:hypothetical protein